MSIDMTSSQRQRLSALAMAGLLAGPFLSMVDSNVVNVALPDIASQLHTSLDTAQWVVSGYLLALAAGLATSAYLAKRFGTRRVYLASLVGFTLASALCALAPTIGFLIAMRAVQGALGAALVPLAMNMLLGGEGAARNMPAAAGIILFLAPALGPTVGGLLINLGGWPLVFLINVPLGVLGALGMLRVPEQPAQAGDAAVGFDPLGMLLLASGLVLAIYGATEGPQRGWSSPAVWPYLAAGGGLLLAYVVWALRRRHPAVDLKLLRHGQPALAVALCTVASVVMFAMLVLIPIFMENIQGDSALVAGLALLPQGLVTGIGLVVGDKLTATCGARFSAILGLLLLTASTGAMLIVTVTTPAWVTALLLSGRGFAVGLTIQPLLLAMLSGLASHEVPDGNTLFNVAERLGGSIGIPILVTFFSLREQERVRAVLQSFGVSAGVLRSGTSRAVPLSPALRTHLARAATAGFHDTIWLLVAISALGCVAALLVRHHQPVIAGEAAPSISERESVGAAEH